MMSNFAITPNSNSIPSPVVGTSLPIEPSSVASSTRGPAIVDAFDLLRLLSLILQELKTTARTARNADRDAVYDLQLKQATEMAKASNMRLGAGLSEGLSMVAAGTVQLVAAFKAYYAEADAGHNAQATLSRDERSRQFISFSQAISSLIQGLGKISSSSVEHQAGMTDSLRKLLEAAEGLRNDSRSENQDTKQSLQSAIQASIDCLNQLIQEDNSVFSQLSRF